MKNSRYFTPVILLTSLFLFTGCYTQLRSLDMFGDDDFYSRRDSYYAWDAYEDAREGENIYAREQTAKEYVQQEADAGEYGLYYKDYEAENWYRENDLNDAYRSGYDKGYDYGYMDARDDFYAREYRYFNYYPQRYFWAYPSLSYVRYYDPWFYDPWFYDSWFTLRVGFGSPFYRNYAYLSYPGYYPYYGYYSSYYGYGYGFGNVFIVNNYGRGNSANRTYGIRGSGITNVSRTGTSSSSGIVRSRTNTSTPSTSTTSGYSKGARSAGTTGTVRPRQSTGTTTRSTGRTGTGTINNTARTGSGSTGTVRSTGRSGSSSTSGSRSTGSVSRTRTGSSSGSSAVTRSTGRSTSTGNNNQQRSSVRAPAAPARTRPAVTPSTTAGSGTTTTVRSTAPGRTTTAMPRTTTTTGRSAPAVNRSSAPARTTSVSRPSAPVRSSGSTGTAVRSGSSASSSGKSTVRKRN